jgi:hypothetical protein
MQYNRELLEMLDRLTTKGITEQTLIKCLIINEIFKLDLDTLTEDLKKYSNLKNAARHIEDKRAKLESEELVLKHKILALEERRQRNESLLKESMDQAQNQFGQLGRKDYDLNPLIKLANRDRQEDVLEPGELHRAILGAIDLISRGLDPNGLTKKILDHAKFSLTHEPNVQNSI